MALQEALADLSAAFALKTASDLKVSESVQTLLLSLVETKHDVPTRYLCVFYANRLFPFSNPLARYINLVCSADLQRQVSDEAKRGLLPFKLVDNSPVPDDTVAFPEFASTLSRA